MKHFVVAAVLVLAGSLAACVTPTGPESKVDGSEVDSQTVAESDDLELEVSYGEMLTKGTLFVDGEAITFEASQPADDLIEVKVELNEMTLTASKSGIGEDFTLKLDGYATKDGSETQLTEDDQLLLEELAYALQQDAQPQETAATTFLRQAVGQWSILPVEIPLQMAVTPDYGRSVTHISNTVYGTQTRNASHDCRNCGCAWYDPSDCCDYTESYDSGRAGFYDRMGECTVPGLANGQYTQDCFDHDACVAGQHAHCDDDIIDTTLCWLCSDEAASAIDDQLGGASSSCQGKCGGSSAGGCYCDTACANFGDCCFDAQDYCTTPKSGQSSYDATYTSSHANCPDSWRSDSYCDKGCQFFDSHSCQANY